MLEYSINSAKQIRVIDKIYVSTDSNLMVNIAYKKVSVIKRPKILCKDDSNELLSWKHAIDFLKMKKKNLIFLLVYLRLRPLEAKKDIIKMIKTFKRTNSDLVISVTKTNRIPNYNMVKVDKSSRAYLAIDKKRLKLKKEEKIYDMTTVGYVAKTQYIEKTKNLLSGKVTAVEIPRERALDIDDNFDLHLGRLLKKKMKKKLGDNWGSGLIGANLADYLSKKNFNIIIIDLKKRHEKFNFYKSDLTNTNKFTKTIDLIFKKYSKIDAVINCAYQKIKIGEKNLNF